MKRSRIEVWRRCAWTVILAALIGYGCNGGKTKVAGKKTEADKQWQAELAALAQKHGALTDWQASLPDFFKVVRPRFSIEVSRALMPTNGQPVLLVMELNHVAESAGHYTAKFEMPFSIKAFFELVLEVTCTPEQAERLMKSAGGLTPEFALVATISEVSRVKLTLQKSYDPEVFVEMNTSPAMFIGKGVCLDFVKRAKVTSKTK
jgi:hypothetical protein